MPDFEDIALGLIGFALGYYVVAHFIRVGSPA